MAITRTGRVRITSEDGLAANVSVTQADGTELPMPIGKIAIDCKPGSVVTAKLTCYLARLDLLTDAEMEIHTQEMVRLECIIRDLASYIRHLLPPGADREAALSRAASAGDWLASHRSLSLRELRTLARDTAPTVAVAPAAPAGATVPE